VAARPGTSRHELGRALDILVDGRPIQYVVPATLIRKHGLSPSRATQLTSTADATPDRE
jgi:hypothetical protein